MAFHLAPWGRSLTQQASVRFSECKLSALGHRNPFDQVDVTLPAMQALGVEIKLQTTVEIICGKKLQLVEQKALIRDRSDWNLRPGCA